MTPCPVMRFLNPGQGVFSTRWIARRLHFPSKVKSALPTPFFF
jgi:hypothetical protein